MKQKNLSPGQLQLLVWCGLLAPAAESLPALLIPEAGQNAWFSVLLGGLLALVLGRLLRSSWDWGDPAGLLLTHMGRGIGTVLLTIYIVWIQLLLTLRLELCAQRLLTAGERDGSHGFFLLVLTLLLLRAAHTPGPGFARAGQLFFAALAGAAVLVLLLALPSARLRRLEPVCLPPLSSVLTAAGLLGWAFPAVFLPTEEAGKGWRSRRDLLMAGLLALAQGIILANLGPGLASRAAVPFFTLAKSVGVEGAFQRGESAIAALWIFSDLVLAWLLARAQRRLLERLTHREERLSPALILCAGLWPLLGLPGLEAAEKLVPAGNLLLGLLLPFLVRWTAGLCEVGRSP